MSRPSSIREFSKPSWWVICCRPAALVIAPILLYLVARALHFLERRHAVGDLAEHARRAHLIQPDVVRPLDGLLVREAVLIAILGHREMRAHRFHAVVVENLARLLAVNQALELRIAGRAQLDLLDADSLHVLQQSGQVAALDAGEVRVGLAADRQAERIGVELDAARRHERQGG